MDAIGIIEGQRNQLLKTWRPFARFQVLYQKLCHLFPSPLQHGDVALFRDQTQANEKNINSEYRFSEVFDEAGIGIFMTCMNGTITLANDEFCRTVGYVEDEVLGMSIEKLSHPVGKAKETDTFMCMMEGKGDKTRYDMCFKGKSGNAIWAILDAIIVKDQHGISVCVVGQTHDMTNRQKIDVLLDEFDRRLKSNMPILCDYQNPQSPT